MDLVGSILKDMAAGRPHFTQQEKDEERRQQQLSDQKRAKNDAFRQQVASQLQSLRSASDKPSLKYGNPLLPQDQIDIVQDEAKKLRLVSVVFGMDGISRHVVVFRQRPTLDILDRLHATYDNPDVGFGEDEMGGFGGGALLAPDEADEALDGAESQEVHRNVLVSPLDELSRLGQGSDEALMKKLKKHRTSPPTSPARKKSPQREVDEVWDDEEEDEQSDKDDEYDEELVASAAAGRSAGQRKNMRKLKKRKAPEDNIEVKQDPYKPKDNVESTAKKPRVAPKPEPTQY